MAAFARLIGAASVLNGAGSIHTLTVSVLDSTYTVEYLHGAIKCFFINAEGTKKVSAPNCRVAAEKILQRELRERGIDRKPDAAKVQSLAHLIERGLKAELSRFRVWKRMADRDGVSLTNKRVRFAKVPAHLPNLARTAS